MQIIALPDDIIAPCSEGQWWIVRAISGEPVAFACIKKARNQREPAGYLCRAGVMVKHRGQGLQRRLIRVREAHAKAQGWHSVVADTFDNPHSGNSLIACGFRLYEPPEPWAREGANYWKKVIT
jgi:GNAT superfamily N-acetyltransferase